MTSTEGIDRFKITVQSNDKIKVEFVQPGEDPLPLVEQYPLNVNDLERATIRVLINMLRDDRLHSDEIKVLGANLYAALFSREAAAKLMDILRNRDTEASHLRVELVFEDKQQDLASWPWEYLYLPTTYGQARTGKFLATMTNKLLLTRYLPLDRMSPLAIDDPPVRVLFVAAQPEGLDDVQYEALLEDLHELKEKDFGGNIEVHELVGANAETTATVDHFLDLVDGLAPNVIHFVGHGKCTDEGGEIAFVDEAGAQDWVKDELLAEWLNDIHSLRLVFLQACESALSGPYQAVSGVAMHLAHQDIPAVVAMQYKVENQIASLFSRAFYKALADREDVDVAVQAGRKEIRSRTRKLALDHAFGLPVLYLRRQGGLLRRQTIRSETPPKTQPRATYPG